MAWPITRSTGFIVTAAAWNEIVDALSTWGGNVNAGGYNLGGLGVVTSVVKGHQLGVHGGSSYAPADTDSCLMLYRVSGSNWGGVGADAVGNLWIRTGLSGTPDSRLVVTATGGVGLISAVNNGSSRPALSQTALPGEIRGFASTNLTDAAGFLRLTAGTVDSPPTQTSYIDLSGYSGIADMDNTIVFGTRAVERMRLTATGNLGLNTPTEFGGGVGVIGIHNRTTAPTTNPASGGVLYVESGALKYRGSSGTVTTVAAA